MIRHFRHFRSIEALCAHEESRRAAVQAAAGAAFSAWLAAELGVSL